jgi:hypothetical protein
VKVTQGLPHPLQAGTPQLQQFQPNPVPPFIPETNSANMLGSGILLLTRRWLFGRSQLSESLRPRLLLNVALAA